MHRARRSSVSRAGARAYTCVRVFVTSTFFCWFFSNYVALEVDLNLILILVYTCTVRVRVHVAVLLPEVHVFIALSMISYDYLRTKVVVYLYK